MDDASLSIRTFKHNASSQNTRSSKFYPAKTQVFTVLFKAIDCVL